MRKQRPALGLTLARNETSPLTPMALPATVPISSISNSHRTRAKFNDLAADELVFAVVGPVGSGTTFVADALERLVASQFEGSKTHRIKVSQIIEKSIDSSELEQLKAGSRLGRATAFQDAGDRLRAGDEAALAVRIAEIIKEKRNKPNDVSAVTRIKEEKSKPLTVHIVDSLKHPTEVELLRGLYREAFCLIGVVCEESTRLNRLREKKCSDSSTDEIKSFMRRDENEEGKKHGQKVSDTFHLADFFVDNTPSRLTDDLKENPEWNVADKLGRLIDILGGKKIIRPDASETGMFHAVGAQFRSACLSRQVGAALVDQCGSVISTGTNEVPAAGGGVYGFNFESSDDSGVESPDHRCFSTNKYCSNNREQSAIINEVISAIPELNQVADRSKIANQLKGTALGRLLEFSRAVHAEMDALLTAARKGVSTVGTKLYVTTFPCHYCARHIVTAGVEEVQYIEPYPKSKALSLHSDTIHQIAKGWKSPRKGRDGKVLFRPFTGVAPRLYRRAFMKDRKLKDENGSLSISEPLWVSGLMRDSYTSLESHVIEAHRVEG